MSEAFVDQILTNWGQVEAKLTEEKRKAEEAKKAVSATNRALADAYVVLFPDNSSLHLKAG